MNNLTIEDLLNLVRAYEPEAISTNKNYNESEGISIVRKAYEYAKFFHGNQMRQSGEPYIIHPLNVAYTLAEMHADIDTICAGLLHDTLEDTETTKENIIREFNEDVATLVDGVTKISKINFSTRDDQEFANTRKIITGITTDVRIIIIKLADRLHNMRTLEYKKKEKQQENALETLEIFVPLAHYIGAYRIKTDLEDLSLKYLRPDDYKKIEEKKLLIENENKNYLLNMRYTINNILNENKIENWIKICIKNIYGIYKDLEEDRNLSSIHDLLALKIAVANVENCYRSLGLIHSKYHPVNELFKDYICNPKNNMYQSLHTTVFGESNKLVQLQIRDYNMDRVASFGLATYWHIKGCDAREEMQKDLKEKCQFFKALSEINSVFDNNQDFVKQIKSELFSNRISVYTTGGSIIELPNGSTPIDFAYELGIEEGNHLVAAIVNDEYVPLNYQLKNNEIVEIKCNSLSNEPKLEWLYIAKTTQAKRLIKQYLANKNMLK